MVNVNARIIKVSGRDVTLNVYPEGEPHAYEITLPTREPTLLDVAVAHIGSQRHTVEIKNGQIVSIGRGSR